MRFVPRPRDWPWALKLVVLLVAAAILPVGALTLYSDVVLRREAVSDESARNLQRARNTVTLLEEYLDDALADIQVVALSAPTAEVLANSSDRRAAGELATLLADVRETQNLPMLSVLDPSGQVVAASDPVFVGSDRSATAFFQSAIAGDSRIHDPRYLAQEREVYLHASVPVFDGAQGVIGVVAARIPLGEVDRLIAADTNSGGRGEFGLLWDARGVALSSPAAPRWRFRPLGPLSDADRERLVASRQFGPLTASLLETAGPAADLVAHARRLTDASQDPIARTDLGTGLLQVAAVPIPRLGWTYAIAAREQDVLLQAHAQSQRNLTAALLTALFSFGLAIVLARGLSRPLDQIRETAQALANGDMHRRTHLERRDEIGQMAQAFDSMADELARKDAALRLHADALERHVTERTAELTGLISAIPDLIFKVNRDGVLVDYSAPPGETLLLPPDAFLGRRVADVLPPDVGLPAMAVMERLLAGESVPSFEYQVPINGELQHFEARGSAAGGDSVVFLVRNVTDRRHQEERMRFLARAGSALTASLDYGNIVETLAQLPVPFMADICVVDLLEEGAARCAAIAAATPELQALMRAERARHPIALSSADPVAAALTKGVAHFEPAPGAPGGRVPFASGSLIVLPLIARGQRLGAMSFLTAGSRRSYTESDFAVAQELTHRAGIALDNARLYRDVQEASRLKDEFLGIVSHELRTPLNAVLGWSQVLRRAPADPEQTRRAALAIERNAQAQARLVEDLLDTSRVISGKIRLAPSAVDVQALVRGAVESFRPVARAAGLEIAAAVPEDAGRIKADAARLQQVLGNLLSNSVKFTSAGGRIDIAVRRSAATIQIRVSDTGAGITPQFLPHVFDRFRQADSTTTRAHGGLGIGLAIARHLVELHGGTIGAESGGPGQGATFTVVLPAGEIGQADSARRPARRQPGARLAGARVLAVDDAADTLELIGEMLTAAGAAVTLATSVEQARHLLQARRPDVLVADIAMPDEDGYALIRSLRADENRCGEARLPAIALTAYARDEDRARSLAAGYDVHLSKPIDSVILIEALTALLDGSAEQSAGPVVR